MNKLTSAPSAATWKTRISSARFDRDIRYNFAVFLFVLFESGLYSDMCHKETLFNTAPDQRQRPKMPMVQMEDIQ